MPKRKLRMFLTSMLLVCAVALSFAVGALALDSGEDFTLSADGAVSEISVSASAAAESASVTDTVVASPTDLENNQSVDNSNSSAAFGTDASFSDLSEKEATTVVEGLDGQISITMGDLPKEITPGMSFEIPVYLATENLKVWSLQFKVNFNTNALELDGEATEDSFPVSLREDSAFLEVNSVTDYLGKIYSCVLIAPNGVTSKSFEQPLQIVTLCFKMPEDYKAVKAVQDSYSGSDKSIDGILKFGITITNLGVSSASEQNSINAKELKASEAAAFSPPEDSTPAKHNHTYNDENGNIDASKGVAYEPTCTKDGGTRYTCRLCDSIIEQEVTGSRFNVSLTGEHTFTKPGEFLEKMPETPSCMPYSRKMYCSVCTDTEAYDVVMVDDVPSGSSPVAHQLQFHPEVKPTADDPGNYPYYYCPECGLYFLGDESSTAENGTSYAKVANIVEQAGTEIPPTGKPEIVCLPGDVNNDGSVARTDAMLLVRNQMVGDNQLTMMINCDVNGDGSVARTDAMLLIRNQMVGDNTLATAEAVQAKWDELGLDYVTGNPR